MRQQIVDAIHDARVFVHRYAEQNAKDVPVGKINAICRALGDISIDEATAAVDRLQAEIDWCSQEEG